MAGKSKAREKSDGWVTLNTAAILLGESRLTTLHRIVKGELVAKHIANRTVVRRDTVDALLAARLEALAS